MAEVRWHINGSGVAGRCKAQPGECPIAPNAPHFETAADARSAYEESMEAAAVAPSQQRAPKPMTSSQRSASKASRARASEAQRMAPSAHGLSGHGTMGPARASEAAAALHLWSSYGHGYSGHGR